MRVAVVSIDSRGGVQPYLALTLGLQRAGHDVRMIVPRDAEPLVTREGVEARTIDADIRATLTAQAETITGSGRSPDRRQALPCVGDWMRQTFAACDGVGMVLAGATGRLIAESVAQARGAVFLAAHLHPIGPPTTAFPSVFLPNVPAWSGGPGRWATHVVADLAMTALATPAVRRARREVLGSPAALPPRRGRAPVLYGFSPHVLAPPASWSRSRRVTRHVTGYWTLPVAPTWSPPPGLARFLHAGPAPVCVGFGSMPTPDPAALGALLVDAARAAGRRVVVLGGWAGLAVPAADDVIVVDEAPHEWLFPRCAAVVHHGGAGTTGAAVRAGAPMVIVPHGADQPFWAAQVQRLGVGPAPVPRSGLTAAALTGALRQCVHDHAMRERSAALGRRVRAEDGVGTAVGIVETHLRALSS